MLYRTDWKFYSKYQLVKIYSLQLPGEDLLLRCETKFANIRVPELVEYHKMVDKRMAWEGQCLYDSIEEVRAYPLQTSLYYTRLQKSAWPSGAQDMLLIQHGVAVQGNRYYLAGVSCEHIDYVGSAKRVQLRVLSTYFEGSDDHVKSTFMISIPGQGKGSGALAGTVTQTLLNNYIESIKCLKRLVEKRIELD